MFGVHSPCESKSNENNNSNNSQYDNVRKCTNMETKARVLNKTFAGVSKSLH